MTEEKTAKATETVDDLILKTQKEEQDAFSEAFDEIVEADPDLKKNLSDDEDGTLDKTDTKGAAFKSEDDKQKTEPEPKKEEKEEEPGLLKGPENTDTVDDPEGTATDETDPIKKLNGELESIKADLASERQRNNSWEGRISAANKRAEEAEARAKELEEKLAAGGNKPADDNSESSDEDEQVLSQFYDDFPELKAPLKILLKKATGKQKAEVMEEIIPKLKKVDEVVETQKETADSEHLNAIRNAHPDIEEIVQSQVMVNWIKQQPSYLRPGLEQVYKNGSTQDAIDLISEFKRVTGYGKTKTENNTENKNGKDKDDKLKSMMQVDSDSSGPPASEPDKSDYDSAAKEAGL